MSRLLKPFDGSRESSISMIGCPMNWSDNWALLGSILYQSFLIDLTERSVT
jgi:hypothetical protein